MKQKSPVRIAYALIALLPLTGCVFAADYADPPTVAPAAQSWEGPLPERPQPSQNSGTEPTWSQKQTATVSLPWVAPQKPSLFSIAANGDPVLEKLYRHAAFNSPRMIEQEHYIVKSDAFRFRGWRQHMPFINAGYQAGYFKLTDREFKEIDANMNLTYYLSFRYPIFAWGAIRAEKEAALLREKLAQGNAVIEWRRLVNTIRSLYFDAVSLKSNIALQEEQLKLEMRRQNRSDAQLDIGRIAEAERLGQQVAIKQKSFDLNALKSRLATTVATIRTTSGFETLALSDIPDTLSFPAVDSEQLARQLDAFHLLDNGETEDARQARLHKSILDEEITQVEARALPNVNLGASISQNPYQLNERFEMRTTIFFGINGTWNIFDRDITNTTVRSLKTEQRVVEARLRAGKVNRLDELKAQLMQIRTTQEILALRQEYLKAAEKRLEGIEAALSLGQSDQLAREDAEMQVFVIRQQIFNDQLAIHRTCLQFLSSIEQDPAVTFYTVPSNEN
ncbi:MAG: TolC family protein [Puniceicoccales bacterium]|nr:TolC family protein [Puniceicoccales bacterium]